MTTFRLTPLTLYALVCAVLLLAPFLTPAAAYMPVQVYGQADYAGSAPNRGGAAGADTLNYPLGITTAPDGGFYVADRNNHRVLYFAGDGDTTADRVYGQFGDFGAHIANNNGAGNSGAPSADNLNMPTAVALDSGGGLYVTDRDNHRVLYFANDGDTTADRVYGQAGKFTTNMVFNDGTGAYGEPSADNFSTYLLGVAVDSQDGLYVSDAAAHRVLYFANDGDTTADRVYGQWDNFGWAARNNDGTGKLGSPSAHSLNFPRGLTVDAGDGLYVADRDNNRVLYFANDGDTTADRVYGQYNDFTMNAANNDGSGAGGAPSNDNLSHPKDMAVGNQGGLYVTDSYNNRVLYFRADGDTTADGSHGPELSKDGSIPGAPLHESGGITIAAGTTFYISDTLNNRVLLIDCPMWEG